MNRRRTIVVVAVLLLCCAGVWLLARAEKDDRRPTGPTTTTTATEAGPATDRRPGPTLAPPTPTTTASPVTEAGPAPTTEAGSGAATERDPTSTGGAVRLRGVRGRVVDASTNQPIRGAFVSWGAPPQKVLDAIRSSPALVEAGEGGELTDASGRFDLPRVDDDRPRFELFASAAGWLPASAVVGLREEVELRLQRAGRLAVRMAGVGARGSDPLTGSARDPVDASGRRVGVVALGPGGQRIQDLGFILPTDVVPGRWRAQADGGEVVEGTVVVGQTTTLEVGAPGRVEFQGKLLGAERAASPSSPGLDAFVEFTRVGELGSTAPAAWQTDYDVKLGAGWTLSGSLPPGVYTARVSLPITSRSGEVDEVSVRAVAAPVRIAPPGPLTLELTLAPVAAVELHLVTGGLEVPSALGLVGGDDDAPDLVALPRSANPRVAGEAVTSSYAGEAPAGRWSVFLGPTYAGEVDLAEGTPATLALRPFEVTVRWRVPEALRDGEVLRGALAVVPLALARRPIGARFREDAAQPFDASRGGEPYHLQLLAPGRYLLAGSTDLGPFEREVELTGATEVEVELAPN